MAGLAQRGDLGHLHAGLIGHLFELARGVAVDADAPRPVAHLAQIGAQPGRGEGADGVTGRPSHATQQLAWRTSISPGKVAACRRASATMASAGSMPVTRTPFSARGTNSGPLPQPTSRTEAAPS